MGFYCGRAGTDGAGHVHEAERGRMWQVREGALPAARVLPRRPARAPIYLRISPPPVSLLFPFSEP